MDVPPPPAGHSRCSGEFSTRIVANMELLVCCDADFHLLFVSGLPRRWWSSQR
jgi:hypothetical protein